MAKPQHILVCWVLALSVVALVCAWAVRPLDFNRPTFEGFPIAVVGSSLSMNAFPPTRESKLGILGDGRPHMRIGVPWLAPAELEELLDVAIADDAETVILEIRPVLFGFNSEDVKKICIGWYCRASNLVAAIRKNFGAHFRRAIGLKEYSFSSRLATAHKEPDLDTHRDYSNELSNLYPVRFRMGRPSARLVQLVERAQHQGTQIVLFSPPRSPTATAYMGKEQATEIKIRSETLARQLDLPLFAPVQGWSDTHFTDTAHLSRIGRVKLQAELRAWWAAQS